MTAPEQLDLTHTGTLIPLLQRYGFSTRKSLGQHFLISRHVLEQILTACALEDGAPVLEIGPGIGTLTRALAESGAEVTAVELDRHAVEVLQETVGMFPSIQVIQGDILHIDLPALLGDAQWTVVGNLPYYITTPVISRLLEVASRLRRMVLMVQREVADRLIAPPGGKIYGSLSVYAQVYANVERIARVPKGAFLPPPTVESAVVRLTPHPEPRVPAPLQPCFFSVVRAAFGQRRKMLENALIGADVLGGDRHAIAEALRAAGIDSTRRGETLSIEEFLRVTEQVIRA